MPASSNASGRLDVAPASSKPSRWRRAFREPLVHFLAAGLTLFAAYGVIDPAPDGASRHDITVDRQALLRFVQFRTRSFDEQRAQAFLGTLSAEELRRLIDDFVREEAMHREAVAWGLDKDDYVIRRRLVQSLEYAARSAGAPDRPLTETELRRYYDDHKPLYAAAPTISFTHVYFSAERHGRSEAQRLASATLARLNGGGTFDAQGWPGDRFLYFANYVDQGPDLVASHFGQAMADRLFRLNPSPGRWQGPIESIHGVHLVRVAEKSSGGVGPYADVRAEVRRDAEEDLTRRRQKAVLDALVAQYRVHRSADLRGMAGGD